MKAAIITIAGVSSRFNQGMPEEKKCHKAIYYEQDRRDTLLYNLLEKCCYADKIVVVVGYKQADIIAYCHDLQKKWQDKMIFVYNEHFTDLGSGYSLYLGIEELRKMHDCWEDVLFVEGDLDIDRESFTRVIEAGKSVLTYSYEPIYANKAVVLYQDGEGFYHYAFNRSHGLLRIDEPFYLLLNSGQLWKFTDWEKLQKANDRFLRECKGESNLGIIRFYVESCNGDSFTLIPLKRWTNCNTREDYKQILVAWEEER